MTLSKNKICLLVSSIILSFTSVSFAADSYDIVEIKNIGEATEANPTPEDNVIFAYGINNFDEIVGYITYPEFKKDTNNDGELEIINPIYSHAFVFDSQANSIYDLGAIDNSSVSIEITNTVNGALVTEVKDFSLVETNSHGFSINNNHQVTGDSFQVFASKTITTSGNTTTETASSKTVKRAVNFDYLDLNNIVVNESVDIVEDLNLDMNGFATNDNNILVGHTSYNPDDDFDSEGNAINTSYNRGFIYDLNSGDIQRIDPIESEIGFKTEAKSINNNNIVVGIAHKTVNDKVFEGVFWLQYHVGMDITSADIKPLILLNNEEGSAYSKAINNNNLIVGTARNEANTYFTAFLYDINNDQSIDLGVLNANLQTPESNALAINNLIQGDYQIVGRSVVSQTQNVNFNHAFLYEKGEMKDLNDLIDCTLDDDGNRDWILYEANSINDSGKIVGNGILNGKLKSFLLTPRTTAVVGCSVEPEVNSGGGTIPLTLIGVLSIFGFYRKK